MSENRAIDFDVNDLAELERALGQIDLRKTSLETLLELIPAIKGAGGRPSEEVSHHPWGALQELRAALEETV